MPITSQNILAHEWIGLRVVIDAAANSRLVGLSGLIRDETRNTFTIESKGRSVRVAKALTTFHATLSNGEALAVDGKSLVHRPEDRVKKGLTKW